MVVALFAMAMAWMESAVVFYLHSLSERLEPSLRQAVPQLPHLGFTEAVREAATLLMICAIGWLAGRTWRSRCGYAAVAFGLWDIFYYIFLKVIMDWPRTLQDWDVLFLLPLPWWGPVIAPMLIALLMVLWGTLASLPAPRDPPFRAEWQAWALNLTGIAIALYVFMEHALHAGLRVAMTRPPVRFNWPLFALALVLMAAPIAHLVRGRLIVRTR